MQMIINKDESELHAALLIPDGRREWIHAMAVAALFHYERTVEAIASIVSICDSRNEICYGVYFMTKEEVAIRDVPQGYKTAFLAMVHDGHQPWNILQDHNAEELEKVYRENIGAPHTGTPLDSLLSVMVRNTSKALLEGPSKNCQCAKCLAKRAEAKDASEAGAAKAAAANRARYN